MKRLVLRRANRFNANSDSDLSEASRNRELKGPEGSRLPSWATRGGIDTSGGAGLPWMLACKGRLRVRAKGQAHRHPELYPRPSTAVRPVCEPQG